MDEIIVKNMIQVTHEANMLNYFLVPASVKEVKEAAILFYMIIF